MKDKIRIFSSRAFAAPRCKAFAQNSVFAALPPNENERNRGRQQHQARHQPAEQRHACEVQAARPRQKRQRGKDDHDHKIPAISSRHGKEIGHGDFLLRTPSKTVHCSPAKRKKAACHPAVSKLSASGGIMTMPSPRRVRRRIPPLACCHPLAIRFEMRLVRYVISIRVATDAATIFQNRERLSAVLAPYSLTRLK